MRNLIIFLLIFPLIGKAEGINPNIVNSSICVSGDIQSFKHNSDESVSIEVQNKSLYTKSWNLQHMLFSAYLENVPVTVRTDNCYQGGEFIEVNFNKKTQ